MLTYTSCSASCGEICSQQDTLQDAEQLRRRVFVKELERAGRRRRRSARSAVPNVRRCHRASFDGVSDWAAAARYSRAATPRSNWLAARASKSRGSSVSLGLRRGSRRLAPGAFFAALLHPNARSLRITRRDDFHLATTQGESTCVELIATRLGRCRGSRRVAARALASSHREAPFITEHPKVDGTDFYMFRSYEPGREGFVTLIANYLPLQDSYGGPNYFTLDPDAVYDIHIDNDGDAREDMTFRFRFKNEIQDLSLDDRHPRAITHGCRCPLITTVPGGIGPGVLDRNGLNVDRDLHRRAHSRRSAQLTAARLTNAGGRHGPDGVHEARRQRRLRSRSPTTPRTRPITSTT